MCPGNPSTHATHRHRSAASLEGAHATLLGSLMVRKNMMATKRKTPALAQKPMCPAHAQPGVVWLTRLQDRLPCHALLRVQPHTPKSTLPQRGMHGPQAEGGSLQRRLHLQGSAQPLAQGRHAPGTADPWEPGGLGGQDAWGQEGSAAQTSAQSPQRVEGCDLEAGWP